MASKKGFFKSCAFGCLGLIVFGMLFAGISALLAWRSLDDQDIQESEGTPVAIETIEQDTVYSGRVILKLGQGEFRILKADPGEGLRIETRYDKEAYSLEDDFVRNPDGTWIYALDFHRTMPGLQAIFQAIMGADTKTYCYVYLPPDAPIALEIYVEEGGFEAEFGGLWLSEAEIIFNKGGFDLDVDEPMREPMERLKIKGAMGGFDAKGLGNASPRRLSVACSMGGADIGLGGAWMQDCDASISVSMGGMSVAMPDNMKVEFGGEAGAKLKQRTPLESEVPLPLMRLDLNQKFGEIDIR